MSDMIMVLLRQIFSEEHIYANKAGPDGQNVNGIDANGNGRIDEGEELKDLSGPNDRPDGLVNDYDWLALASKLMPEPDAKAIERAAQRFYDTAETVDFFATVKKNTSDATMYRAGKSYGTSFAVMKHMERSFSQLVEKHGIDKLSEHVRRYTDLCSAESIDFLDSAGLEYGSSGFSMGTYLNRHNEKI